MSGLNSTSWLLIESGQCEAAINMALDEAMLQAMPRLNRPILRFYGWAERAASFGYFQHYAEVERVVELRPVIRRPTGGGIVRHDGDWTYSLAFPTSTEWYSLTATQSYQRVHEWIRAAFGRLNYTTELAPTCRRAQAGQCFSGYERFDVLWRGQKIAGAAQRRTRDGLLIQGSVHPPLPVPARPDWHKAMCAATPGATVVTWEEFDLDAPLRERVKALVQTKYSTAHYNQKR
jgi:lipoate-protein ligase A